MMLRVGLTGGIGCGKSAVAAELRRLGAPVVDTDQLARAVVEPGRPAFEAIVKRFGPSALDGEGRIDRAALGRVVFGDEGARRDLEAIVHPPVILEAQRWMVEEASAGAPLAVVEVPLLYEAGLEGIFGQVVVVAARPETQLARVKTRDGLSEEEARARLESQMPVEEKARRADQVLWNDGSLEELREAVGGLYSRLLELAEPRGGEGS